MKRLAFVIEDDARLSLIFSEAVRQAGYQVVCCATGAQALEKIGDGIPPHLVILDLHLPDVSGVEILHTIRRSRTLDETIVVLATADPLLANLYRDQADFLLVKPISYSQLRDLATRFLTGKRPGKTGALNMPST